MTETKQPKLVWDVEPFGAVVVQICAVPRLPQRYADISLANVSGRKHAGEDLSNGSCAGKNSGDGQPGVAEFVAIEGACSAEPTVPPTTYVPGCAAGAGADPDDVGCGLCGLAGGGPKSTRCL